MVAVFLYAASTMKFFDRDPLSQQVGPQGPIQLVVLIAIILAFAVTIRRYAQRVIIPSSAYAYLTFGVFALVSSAFSFYPLLSFSKGVAFLLACAAAILACSLFRAADVIKYLYYSFTIILAAQLVIKVATGFPVLSFDETSGRTSLNLAGLHPTLLGELSSVVLLSGLLLRKRPPLYCQAFLFVMAVLSGSRTGSTLLFVAIVITWLLSVRLDPRFVSLYCGLGCFLVLLLIGALMSDRLSSGIVALTRPLYGDTVSRDVSSLDGRTDVWDAAAPALAHSIILGYGLGGARDALVNNTSKFWVAGDSHNAYVELALAGGLFAVLIYLTGWAVAVWRASRSRGALRVGALAVYIYIAAFGVVAPDLTNLQALCTFLIITTDALVCQELAFSRSKLAFAVPAPVNQQPLESPAGT
jgi:hypothetical protein